MSDADTDGSSSINGVQETGDHREDTGNRIPIGLALGSGGARGWAHIGVIRGLKKLGIEADIVCGTSVGALVGAVHLGGDLDALEAWAQGLGKLSLLRYLDYRMLGGGFIAGRKIQNLLENSLGDVKIEDLKRPFAAVATDLTTGHEVWLRRGSLAEAARSSFALPGILPPVPSEGQLLADGALVNPIPVSVCRALGSRLVIAVNLNTDHLGRRPDHHAAFGMPTDGETVVNRRAKSRKHDNSLIGQFIGRNQSNVSLYSVMVASLNVFQDRLTRIRLASDPPDVTITPHVGHIGLLEFDRAAEVVQEGEDAVERALPTLREALDILGG
jgi:NTE family protein